MADDKYTFEQARIRLEEIATEVRKKDTSLEKSLDLLEEGVRLANICTELVDHTDVSASVTVPQPEGAVEDTAEAGAVAPEATPEVFPGAGAEQAEAASVADDAQQDPEASADEGAAADAERSGDGFDDTEEEVDEPSDADPDD